jgi:hypothetical protein
VLITLSSSVGKVAEEQIALIDSDYKRTIKRIMDRQSGFVEMVRNGIPKIDCIRFGIITGSISPY